MPQPIVMPSMGMYCEEGVLSAWLRPAGARVEIGEAIAEVTTEKVTFEIPSAAAGILHPVAEVGRTLRVAELFGYILADGEAVPTVAEPEAAPDSVGGHSVAITPATGDCQPSSGSLRASPAARRLANQHGIDLRDVQGSGPGGRIVEADVLARISR
ncbi:MAG TPA: E3 binding domain-containing protein [Candidatus Acidoferrum sp.]|nr:E3 binding domain-containing protein [Candidatus Acidoferrum sp.]